MLKSGARVTDVKAAIFGVVVRNALESGVATGGISAVSMNWFLQAAEAARG